MRRGEIWTVVGDGGYASKPRPAVMLQDDRFDATQSVTICAMTTDPTDAPVFRVPVVPSESNGLREPCRLLVDRITTVQKSRLGSRIGALDADDMTRLNRATIVFLGLAAPARSTRRQSRRNQ